jgi:FMN-dependent NADH-azoreductase
MSRILHVGSSPRGDASYSNKIAARVVRELQQANPQTTVTVRDLAQDPLAHIDADFVAATRSANGLRTERQRASLPNLMLWSMSCSPPTPLSSPRR